MKLLLDTHALLWFLREPAKLPADVLREIQLAGPDAMVSMGSLWEIAVKSSLGKLELPDSFDKLFPQSVFDSGLSLLPIEPSHFTAVNQLPWHHRDPFDRLLIAQAKVEHLTLVSRDGCFSAYAVPRLWS